MTDWPQGVRASITPGDIEAEGFDQDYGLAMMLLNHVCSMDTDWDPQCEPLPETRGFPIWVNCSDIFVWGSSDAEILPYDQLESLYKLWRHDRSWGGAIWCMIARREMPQEPVEEAIRKEGVWDLDALKAEHGLRANYVGGLSMVEASYKYAAYCRWETDNGHTPSPFDARWWTGWERFTQHNPGWETDAWKAAVKALEDSFKQANGYA